MKKRNSILWRCFDMIFFFLCVILICLVWKQTIKNQIEFLELDNQFHIEDRLIEMKYKQTQQNHFIKKNSVVKNEFTPVFDLSDEERWIACCMVAGESKGESYEGQWAVAQCIYQACINDGLQPSEVRIEYKYSGWDEKLEFDNPELWEQIEEIVSRVFDYGEMCVDDEILWFYAPRWMKNGTSQFHESQRFIIQIGEHKFFGEWD